jgi:hypothetical protein
MVGRDRKRSQLPFRTVFTYQLSAPPTLGAAHSRVKASIGTVAEAGARVKSW